MVQEILNFPYFQYYFVFCATFLVDVAWTKYLISVEQRKVIASGIWAVVIYLFGALIVLSYTTDHYLLIPAVIGSFLGTSRTVYKKKQTEIKNATKN